MTQWLHCWHFVELSTMCLCTIKGHVGITELTRPAPCLKYTHSEVQTFLLFIQLLLCWINSVHNIRLVSFLGCFNTLATQINFSEKVCCCVLCSIFSLSSILFKCTDAFSPFVSVRRGLSKPRHLELYVVWHLEFCSFALLMWPSFALYIAETLHIYGICRLI